MAGIVNLFVYGTLRNYEENHRLMSRSTCVAMQARTRGRLYDTGFGYPTMVPGDSTWTYGEVYQVDDAQLAKIAELAAYRAGKAGSDFDLVSMTISTDHGETVALVYVGSDTQVAGMRTMQSGDWRVAHVLSERDDWLFFAYGSAMDDRRLKEAGVEDAFQDVLGCGVLDGYSLCFTRQVRDGSRADVMETGGRTEGKVYRIGRTALEYLFIREGVHHDSYRPALIDVDVAGELCRDAVAFLTVNKAPETSPPDWYAAEILRGGAGCLSEAYLNEVRCKVAALENNGTRMK